MGPAELVQAVAIARRYFLDGASKTDIATEFALSRFKVARILDACRSEGLVRVDISLPVELDVEASEAVRKAYGLKSVLVVRSVDERPESIREVLGVIASDLLSEVVTESDVLGLGWGRSVSATVTRLSRLARCSVVQLTGVVGDPSLNAVELVRIVAAKTGGDAFPLYAPMVVSDPDTATALGREPAVRDTMSQFDSVTVALVAVGSWDPPDSQLHDDLPARERLQLRDAGVTAEICSTLVDADGVHIAPAFGERCIALGAEQLRKIPRVIAVAGGPTKATAVRAVLRGRLVDTLVTDSSVARVLLEG